jgi:hypothetical protein
MTLVCNMVRPSSANPEKTILTGPSSKYPTEDWLLDYFSIEKDKSASKKEVICKLPSGYEKAWDEHGEPGRPEGPMYKVRAWGMEFCTYYLKWCDEYRKIRDSLVGNDASLRASFDLNAIGWDLPGHFIIASKEHPFYATSPLKNKYVYDRWCSYEQAIEEIERTKR